MSYVVLARKYRPKSFDQMVGQEHVVRALSNALEQQRLHHAYLFTGTRGIGKTTVSRILAKSLNCTGPDGQGGITAHPCGVCQACTEIDADRYIDYIELDAASNRSIEEVRDLIERAAYKPGVGRFKVFMIDEAHQLTKDAFNALLKTLEEPPEYLKFVLATTDPEKMLPTVLSRCLQFNLRPMAPDTVQEYLAQVLAAESVTFDDGSLRLLGRAARGSMRDALSLTDQAIAYGGGKLDEAVVRAMLGSVDRHHAAAVVEALAARDGAAVLNTVDALRAQGLSAAGTLEEMARLLQQMAVEQAVPGALDTRDPEAAEAQRLAGVLPADETQLLYSIVLHGREELALMSDEYGALTMVLLRLLAFPPAGGAPVKPVPRSEPRAAPLRAPAPPAIKLPVPPVAAPAPRAAAPRAAAPGPVPVPAPAPAAASVPPWVDEVPDEAPGEVAPAAPVRVEESPAPAPTPALVPTTLGDRWQRLVLQMAEKGTISALVRELAWQATLVQADDDAQPARWVLVVERESLRTPALQERLANALAAEWGSAVALDLQAGTAGDSPARRDAAERVRRQAEAEDLIRNDPVVQTLMGQFKTARIVPGSIKPA